MSGGSGEDIYVNVDRLKRYGDAFQDDIEAMERFLESSGRGALREAVQDGAKFGGFAAAGELAQEHAALVEEMRRLLYGFLNGIQTAKLGIDQTAKNYHSTDDQHGREFLGIDQDMDNAGGGQP